MTEHKRPEWIEKAALAVAALYAARRAKEHVQASEAKLKSDVHEAQQIADIIHQHYQEHR